LHQQRPPKYTHSFIDSCAFDPDDEGEYLCSRRLLDKSDDLDLELIVAHSVQKEIEHPNTPDDVKVLAQSLIYTIESELTQPELEKREEIRALVRGNAKIGNHENDADHIFELFKYGGGYFITTDNRLLSKAEEFFTKYFVTTIKPTEYEKLLCLIA